jgi:hypothetical protein
MPTGSPTCCRILSRRFQLGTLGVPRAVQQTSKTLSLTLFVFVQVVSLHKRAPSAGVAAGGGGCGGGCGGCCDFTPQKPTFRTRQVLVVVCVVVGVSWSWSGSARSCVCVCGGGGGGSALSCGAHPPARALAMHHSRWQVPTGAGGARRSAQASGSRVLCVCGGDHVARSVCRRFFWLFTVCQSQNASLSMTLCPPTLALPLPQSHVPSSSPLPLFSLVLFARCVKSIEFKRIT